MRLSIYVVALLFLLCRPCAAEELQRSESIPCEAEGSEACFLTEGHRLIEADQAKKTAELLKIAVKRHPDSRSLTLLLACAYQVWGNDFWALRTVLAFLESHPGDCEAAGWAAWMLLSQGALSEAREIFSDRYCPDSGPLATRKAILLTLISQHEDKAEEALESLRSARKQDLAFPEDRPAISHLNASVDPWYVRPITGQLELAGGWTSNAQAGSPADPAQAGSSMGSPMGQVNGRLQFTPNFDFWIHPSLEGEFRLQGFSDEVGRDLSYALLSGRPGLLFGGSRWNVLAAYRYDGLLLAGGDRYNSGPNWLFHAHRGEIEAQPIPQLTLFFGAGRREFREIGRSRTEVDGGLGGGFKASESLKLMGAIRGRWQDAQNSAYDLMGGSILLSMEQFLPMNFSLRALFSFQASDYPHSAGYFDKLKPKSKRSDRLYRLSPSVWSPGFYDMRVGLVYSYSKRVSTADPYAYQEHRILARLIWNFGFDPWLPDVQDTEGHIPLRTGLGSQGGAEDRIQDLLRQDEAAQRSSSCLE